MLERLPADAGGKPQVVLDAGTRSGLSAEHPADLAAQLLGVAPAQLARIRADLAQALALAAGALRA